MTNKIKKIEIALKILHILGFIIILFILLSWDPFQELRETDPKVGNPFLFWFIFMGAGITYLNCRSLSFMSKFKKGANVWDLFSTHWGSGRIIKNPNDYFTPEVYELYKKNWRNKMIFIVGWALLLLIIGFVIRFYFV